MKKWLIGLAAATMLAAAVALPPAANHSWGGYHWARTANPFTIKLGDNLTSDWKPYSTRPSSWPSVKTKLPESARSRS